MSHMKLIVDHGPYWLVSGSDGAETLVPEDLVGREPELAAFAPFTEGEPESFERQEGFYARLSAPGYIDSTPWFACKSEQEARDTVAESYGVPQCSLCRELQEDDFEGEHCAACAALAAEGWSNPSEAMNADPEPCRVIRFAVGPGFRLDMYDANKRGEYGKHGVSYRFFEGDTEIFSSAGGKELFSPGAIDEDNTACELCSFLFLKPGDTDPDYFDDYTPEQLAFCDRCAEELSMAARDLLGED